MIFLKNDYSLGAHPKVMEALNKTNLICSDGYGLDPFCKEAENKIKSLIKKENAQVHFLMAGTQTNMTAISAFLRPHQGVISAETGHICVHETGAIEATGHKVIHVPSLDGKLYPKDIDKVMELHEDEHYVMPKMIYISNSTETGNFYSKEELYALREICDKHELYLYIDGARLAMGLTARGNNATLLDIANVSDAFYMGGTKNGMLFGEALVLINPALMQDFRFLLKQRGGMLAKGRLLGVQFNALLENDLYFSLGEHANNMAYLLADKIAEKGYSFDQEPKTNLIFPIFPKELVKALGEKVMFENWKSYEDSDLISIRLVTSWGTTEQEIKAFIELI